MQKASWKKAGLIMATNDIKERVLNVLTINNHVPVKTTPICAVLNIKPRQLQQAVHDLRMDRVKVCSGDQGYWIWNGQDDSWNHTKRQIQSRIRKLSQMYHAMDGTPLDGQIGVYDSFRDYEYEIALRDLEVAEHV